MSIILPLLLLVFMCFLIYYSYEGTKLPNPRKWESIVVLIFSIIFVLLMIIMFAWSIVHMFMAKKQSEKIEDLSAKAAVVDKMKDAVPYNGTVNLNATYSSSSSSAADPLNVNGNVTSFAGDDFSTARQANDIKAMLAR